jgi:hypothetical protein
MTKYVCPHCNTEWTQEELSKHLEYSLESFEEAEGCPECLHECERCGTLKGDGREHCL